MDDMLTVAIITYNPDIALLRKNILSFYKYIEGFLIVDNGSANVNDIESLIISLGDQKITLIKNKKNLGIGQALNIALKWSKKNNYHWFMTLDQDSVCAPNYFEEILPMLDSTNVGIIYPNIIDERQFVGFINNRSIVGSIMENFKLQIKRFFTAGVVLPITSGAVTNTGIATKIGGYCESMFIDGVDFDFALKIYEAGFSIIPCRKAVLYHNLGSPTSVDIAGVRLTASGHNSTRCYYMNKNSWYLFYKHHKYFLRWTIYNILAALFMGFRNAIVSKRYVEFIHQTIKGQINGMTKI